MNTQKVKVICLPTDKNKDGFYPINTLMFAPDTTAIGPGLFLATEDRFLESIPQHLYFLDTNPDTKLQDGDCFIWRSGISGTFEIHKFHSDAGYGIKTYTSFNEKDGSSVLVNYSGYCGKILASTDKFLGLPGIEESFIKLYAEKQGKIDEVEIRTIINGSTNIYAIIPETNSQNQVIVVNIDKIEAQEEIQSTRQIAKEEFDKASKHFSLLDWHTWKRAFDCAIEYQKQQISTVDKVNIKDEIEEEFIKRTAQNGGPFSIRYQNNEYLVKEGIEYQKQQTPFSKEDMKAVWEDARKLEDVNMGGGFSEYTFIHESFETWFEETYLRQSKTK